MREKNNEAYKIAGMLVLGSLIIIMALAIGKACKVLPDTICFRAKENCGVTMEQMEKVSYAAGEWSEEGILQAEFFKMPQTVSICYTTSTYGDLASVKMKTGNYFWVDQIPEYNKKAVISDVLAISLFGTDQIVENEIELNGDAYQVYGIYEKPNGFLADCCAEEEKIYVPYPNYNSHEEAEPMKPDTVYVRNTDGRMKDALADAITETSGMPFYYDEVTDYAEEKYILKQNLFVPIFFVLTAFLICAVRKTADIVGKKRKNYKVSVKVVAVVGTVCLGSLLIAGLKRGIRIPDILLPEDDIFDVRHYKEAVSQIFVLHRNIGKECFYWNYKSVMIIFTSIGSIFVSFSIVSTEILKGLMSAFSHK